MVYAYLWENVVIKGVKYEAIGLCSECTEKRIRRQYKRRSNDK